MKLLRITARERAHAMLSLRGMCIRVLIADGHSRLCNDTTKLLVMHARTTLARERRRIT